MTIDPTLGMLTAIGNMAREVRTSLETGDEPNLTESLFAFADHFETYCEGVGSSYEQVAACTVRLPHFATIEYAVKALASKVTQAETFQTALNIWAHAVEVAQKSGNEHCLHLEDVAA